MKILQLKYPIGKYKPLQNPTTQDLKKGIKTIKSFPKNLSRIIRGLDKNQLNWQYRPQGWSIKQLVHHCADSHINCYVRIKLTLTEDNPPTIQPYDESKWAQLFDAQNENVKSSVLILKGLHFKWTLLLQNLTKVQLSKTFYHPQHATFFTIEDTIGMYAWHCSHHLEHIKLALKNKGKIT